ncbi:hypothetical protein Tco_1358090 [Tanacetum coccineum]
MAQNNNNTNVTNNNDDVKPTILHDFLGRGCAPVTKVVAAAADVAGGGSPSGSVSGGGGGGGGRWWRADSTLLDWVLVLVHTFHETDFLDVSKMSFFSHLKCMV